MEIAAPTADRIARIESIVSRDVGRSIAKLAALARGGLLGAAQSIATLPAPHVGIITGFFVPWSPTPAGESDGPVGAAMIAASLTALGIPCRIATDAPCADPVRAALEASGASEAVPLDIVALPGAAPGGVDLERVTARWQNAPNPITHAVAIERCGPASDGKPHNFRGDDISAHTAPLERLFMGGPWTTIAMGDGGNELGMGNIPSEVIAADVRNGERVACVVPADHLIVLGVSNWGGYALPAALAMLRPDWRDAISSIVTEERDRAILEACVETGGAVDGITGERAVQADGQPLSFHAEVLRAVRAVMAENP